MTTGARLGYARLGYTRLGTDDAVTQQHWEPAPVAADPLQVIIGGVDVSRLVYLGSLGWDVAIGRTPEATVTLHDSDDPTGVLPAIVETEDQGAYAYPVMVVLNEGARLFRGPVTNVQRSLPIVGIITGVSAEGWQRLAASCPVEPQYQTAARTWDDTAHTWEMSDPTFSPAPILDGDGNLAIARAVSWWRGPALTLDCPDTLTSGDPFHVRGESLAEVMDGILDRCGGGFWWIDADMVLHVRYCPEGVGAGEETYTGPAGLLASWSLGETPADDVIVPTGMDETAKARDLVSGVYAEGRTVKSSRYVRSGDAWGGAVMMTVPTARGTMVASYARRELKGPKWEITTTAILPPLRVGQSAPQVGQVIRVDYMAWHGYYLVRGVSARAAVSGLDLYIAEWRLDLGSAPVRSFAREVPEDVTLLEPPGPVYTKQVKTIETAPVDQNMRAGDRQYIYAWAVDGDYKRVAMDAGTVQWTIVADGDEIGAGSELAGWTLSATSSEVVYTVAEPLGFVYVELTCYDTDTYPRIKVRAYLEESA